MIEMYAHENQMFNVTNGTISSDYIVRFTAICTWALANGFMFGYQIEEQYILDSIDHINDFLDGDLKVMMEEVHENNIMLIK